MDESCPCCRHEVQDPYEGIPSEQVLPDAASVDTEMVEYDRFLSRTDAQIRAVQRFCLLKEALTKRELEDYAASRIISFMKGIWPKRVLRNHLQLLREDELLKDRISRWHRRQQRNRRLMAFHARRAHLSRKETEHLGATMIQAACRGWQVRRGREVQN